MCGVSDGRCFSVARWLFGGSMLVGGFGCVIIVVLGNTRPLLLSPCRTLWLNSFTLL